MKNTQNMGKGGECVCPKCKKEIEHKRGIPCQKEKCPECGSKMLRTGSEHYNNWKEKQK